MIDSQTDHGTKNPLRNMLIDAIIFRIGLDVLDEIPSDLPEQIRKAIMEEVMPHSRYVLESLGTDELQDEVALHRHIQGVLASTTYLVNRIREQRSRS